MMVELNERNLALLLRRKGDRKWEKYCAPVVPQSALLGSMLISRVEKAASLCYSMEKHKRVPHVCGLYCNCCHCVIRSSIYGWMGGLFCVRGYPGRAAGGREWMTVSWSVVCRSQGVFFSW